MFELELQQLKKYLIELSLLFTSNEGQLVYVYLNVSKHAISLVLLREVDAEQRLIYFFSKTFTNCQTKYLLLENLVLALALTL